jgi:hypothetical protein
MVAKLVPFTVLKNPRYLKSPMALNKNKIPTPNEIYWIPRKENTSKKGFR